MIKKRNFTKISSCFLALVVLFVSALCPMSAGAESKVDELKDKIAQYEEKIDGAQEKLDALKGDISKVQAYIEQLDAQIAMYQEQIDAYNFQIDEYQKQIDDYEAQNDELRGQISLLNDRIDDYNGQIDNLNTQIDGKYSELKDFIRSTYMTGESSALEVLLCSDDFSDYLTRVQFMSSIADYEQGLIDSINSDIAAIDAAVNEINKKKGEITAIQDQINAKIESIKALQASIEANKQKVVANQKTIEAKVYENSNYLASLNDESAEYKRQIAQYEKEIKQFDAQIEALIRRQASSGTGTLANSSGLICPLQYPGVYVTSGYYRHSGGYHGALDLSVSGGCYGKAISAAEAGVVVTAAYHWSYGNYIIIDHGNGLSTLYAHCSSLAAKAGQSASKGQTIAYVGSTGNATGPHLHFEVRVNGKRVNPAGYIKV